MAIIVNLEGLLRSRKMQVRELASRIDITETNLSRIKTGKVRAIRFSTLDSLCKEVRCKPGDIIDYIPDDEIDHSIHIVCWSREDDE